VQSTGALNYTERSAVGVVVLVSPWNLPLYLLTFKMAPALVCGNAVVCKPSEMTSVTAWMLCDLFRQAGACCHGNGTFRYQVPPFARIVTATARERIANFFAGRVEQSVGCMCVCVCVSGQ